MKLLTASVAGWLALLGLLLPWLLGTATATPTPPPEDDRPLFREGSGFYRTCESLMGGGDGLVTLTPGVATILRAISCDTPSEVHVDGNVLLRSHSTLDTTGIHFIVHAGATLTIQAPAIDIKRAQTGEAAGYPVFMVDGRLKLESTAAVPALLEETESEDAYGLMWVGSEGSVHSEQTIGFTTNSIKVAGMTAKEEHGEPARLSPRYASRLTEYHARLRKRSGTESPADEPPLPTTKVSSTDSEVLPGGDILTGSAPSSTSATDADAAASSPSATAADTAAATAAAAGGTNASDTSPEKSRVPVGADTDTASADANAHDTTVPPATAAVPNSPAKPIDPSAPAHVSAPKSAGGTDGSRLRNENLDQHASAAAAAAAATAADGAASIPPTASSPHPGTAPANPPSRLSEAFDDADSNEPQQQPGVQNERVFRRCDDIPDQTVYDGGSITLTHRIVCPFLKPIVITGDVVVQSDKDIFTEDVIWVVDEGGHLTFVAPTVTLARSKASQQEGNPMLMVVGTAEFKVSGWVPLRPADKPPGNEGVVFRHTEDAVVLTEQKVFITDNAVVAVDPSAAAAGEPEATTEDDLGDTTLPRDPDLVDIVGTEHAGFDDKRSAKQPGAAGGDDNGGSRNGDSSSSNNDGNRTGHSSSDSSSNDGGSSKLEYHPGRVLKVGDRMTGILLSPDETSALFSDPDDGSLTFWRMPSQEGGGGGDGGGTSEVATLIPSNPRSVGKVYSIRVDVVSEKLRQAKMEVDGEEQKPGVVRKAMGWLPFGRDGFIRKNQREHAEANWGETYVTLTDRGRLEGFMDGRRVFREGGPSFFNLGRKRTDYEVRATAEGLEETKAGAPCWKIKLKT